MKINVYHEAENDLVKIEKYKNKLLYAIIKAYDEEFINYHPLEVEFATVVLNSFDSSFYKEMINHNQLTLNIFIERLILVTNEPSLEQKIYKNIKEI